MSISEVGKYLKPHVPQERQIREREFHDQYASSVDVDTLLVKETFEAVTAIENQYALEFLGTLNGKNVLDVGCGAGEASVYFATKGAKVHGCDLSANLLNVASALAGKFNTEPSFTQAQLEQLPYQSNWFDFVYGMGVLHHVDLEAAAQEVHRVLKPGGKAVFIEPLPYNPAINVYRYLAKDVRTKDERPLSFRQVKYFAARFSSAYHREFWFFSLLVFLHFYFIRNWNPSKVRYWKKVIEEADAYSTLFPALQTADRWILRYFPWLGFLCWNTVICVTK